MKYKKSFTTTYTQFDIVPEIMEESSFSSVVRRFMRLFNNGRKSFTFYKY